LLTIQFFFFDKDHPMLRSLPNIFSWSQCSTTLTTRFVQKKRRSLTSFSSFNTHARPPSLFFYFLTNLSLCLSSPSLTTNTTYFRLQKASFRRPLSQNSYILFIPSFSSIFLSIQIFERSLLENLSFLKVGLSGGHYNPSLNAPLKHLSFWLSPLQNLEKTMIGPRFPATTVWEIIFTASGAKPTMFCFCYSKFQQSKEVKFDSCMFFFFRFELRRTTF
jgi:hypothetical protein